MLRLSTHEKTSFVEFLVDERLLLVSGGEVLFERAVAVVDSVCVSAPLSSSLCCLAMSLADLLSGTESV